MWDFVKSLVNLSSNSYPWETMETLWECLTENPDERLKISRQTNTNFMPNSDLECSLKIHNCGPTCLSIMEEHVRAVSLLQVEYDRVSLPQQPDQQQSLDRDSAQRHSFSTQSLIRLACDMIVLLKWASQGISLKKCLEASVDDFWNSNCVQIMNVSDADFYYWGHIHFRGILLPFSMDS